MRKSCLLLVLCLFAASTASAQISLFTGNWKNSNPSTRGIVKLTVAGTTPVLSIQVWGACTPSPCDWGKNTAYAYGPNVTTNPVTSATAVTTIYTTSFSQTILTLHRDPTGLIVSLYTRFTDKSGRFAYTSTEHFVKVP